MPANAPGDHSPLVAADRSGVWIRPSYGVVRGRSSSRGTSNSEAQVIDLGFVVEPPDRIELSTYALRVRRSTD